MGRVLLPQLKNLVLELVGLSEDLAALEISEHVTALRRVRKGLLVHIHNCRDFRVALDGVRKEIERKRKDVRGAVPGDDLNDVGEDVIVLDEGAGLKMEEGGEGVQV